MTTKYDELLKTSEHIDDVLKMLNEEVSNLEKHYIENYKCHNLQKENEELEKLIVQHVKELESLEAANGKKSISCQNKAPTISVPKNKEKETPTPPPAVSIAVVDNKNIKNTQQNVKNQTKDENKPQTNKKKAETANKSSVAEESLPIDVGRLDFKVGKIVEVEKHKDADSLYVEKIDIGGAQPITVVSGLVKHVPIEQMRNRMVIILGNLKPAKMRGTLSEAMVMCASTPDKVEVLAPPPDSKPGDRVIVPGFPPPPNGPDPVLNPKKKIFETLAPELLTDSECCATFRSVRWEVNGGFVKSATLKNVNIK